MRRAMIGVCAWMMTSCLDLGRAPDEVPAPAVSPQAPAAVDSSRTAPDTERMGKVVEVIDSGGYTYARVDACGVDAWVAGPVTVLKAGSTVVMPQGMEMTNFEAKSLGRTFDSILFVNWIRPTDQEPDCSGGATAARPAAAPTPAALPPGHPAGLATGAAPKAAALTESRLHGRVEETMDSGGYTYARIESCGKQMWLAGPTTPMKVGDFVQSPDAMAMDGFKSSSLGRTFEQLFFVSRFVRTPGGPDCS